MRAAVWLEIDTALCLSPTPVHICAIVAASTSVCVCASVCGSTHACTAGHAFSAGFCCTVSRWRSWKKSLAPNGVRCCCCRCRRTVYLWLPFPSAALFLGSYPAEEREKNISLCASSVLKTGKSLWSSHTKKKHAHATHVIIKISLSNYSPDYNKELNIVSLFCHFCFSPCNIFVLNYYYYYYYWIIEKELMIFIQ